MKLVPSHKCGCTTSRNSLHWTPAAPFERGKKKSQRLVSPPPSTTFIPSLITTSNSSNRSLQTIQKAVAMVKHVRGWCFRRPKVNSIRTVVQRFFHSSPIAQTAFISSPWIYLGRQPNWCSRLSIYSQVETHQSTRCWACLRPKNLLERLHLCLWTTVDHLVGPWWWYCVRCGVRLCVCVAYCVQCAVVCGRWCLQPSALSVPDHFLGHLSRCRCSCRANILAKADWQTYIICGLFQHWLPVACVCVISDLERKSQSPLWYYGPIASTNNTVYRVIPAPPMHRQPARTNDERLACAGWCCRRRRRHAINWHDNDERTTTEATDWRPNRCAPLSLARVSETAHTIGQPRTVLPMLSLSFLFLITIVSW